MNGLLGYAGIHLTKVGPQRLIDNINEKDGLILTLINNKIGCYDPEKGELMETEYIYPHLGDRSSPEDWIEKGSTDIWDRARLEATRILSEAPPRYINNDCDRLIRDNYNIQLRTPSG